MLFNRALITRYPTEFVSCFTIHRLSGLGFSQNRINFCCHECNASFSPKSFDASYYNMNDNDIALFCYVQQDQLK